MLDLVIRGGELIDGTGAPRRRADVGIDGDRVVALGRVEGPARTELDATGRVVTPGFVDVHTHLDAQVFWDPALTPAPLHGVTTVVAGNCGFTIAPLSGDRADAAYLLAMLARVEGIPPESLRAGVPWSWRSTAEYFDAIEGRLGINAGFMVGHSTIRRVVMGPGATRGPADADQVAAMARLVHDGLEAGALGLSSSWARTHNDAEGAMVPSRHAAADELIELCRAVGDHEGTSLEFIPCNFAVPFEGWATDLVTAMTAGAARPLNWNAMFVRADNLEHCRAKLDLADHARRHGGRVVALTMPVNNGFRLNFRSGFVFDAVPGWEELMAAPLDHRLHALADPGRRASLRELAARPHPIAAATDWASHVIFDTVDPANEQYRGQRVADIAAAEGRDAFDVLCDIAVADELHTSFGTEPPEELPEDWEARLEIWRDPRALIGASDAGAHLDLLDTFAYPTRFLGLAVRQAGVLGLEEAIHLLTERPADLYGLRDRGRLEEGSRADVVVLDPRRVGAHEVAMRFDLPGGAGRLYAEADGIDHVVCNGQPVVRDGRLTGERPGTLLRSGRDTVTPSLA